MAKKRKEKKEEDEIDFKLPKFDEKKFLIKERRNVKTLFLSFLLGLIIAVISFGFWVLLTDSFIRWELILLLGVFNASWLKYIFIRLNIDLTDFGRKGWFGSYAIYFFTWLIVIIVLVNPPFYDDESPHVELVTLPGVQEIGGSILIVANIVDNVGIDENNLEFTITDPNGTVITPIASFNDGIFRCVYENSDNIFGDFEYNLKVTDLSGHITTKSGVFEYNNNALSITSSVFNKIRSGDSITIKADENICIENFRVFYRLDNGSEINVDRDNEDNKEEYQTSAEFIGWSENSNFSMKVYAEAMYYFENIPEKFYNFVEDTNIYNFSTDKDSNIGTEPLLVEYNYTLEKSNKKQLPNTLNYKLPRQRFIAATPGFEIALFLISLIIVAFIFKYRKKDKKK